MDNIKEANKILEAVADSIHEGNKGYDTQLAIQLTPGVDEANHLMSMMYRNDPRLFKMGIEMGVYLTLRYLENKQLENLYGDILK